MDAGLAFEQVLAEIRLRQAGVDDDDADAEAVEFGPQGVREPGEGELARRVQRPPRPALAAQHRRDVHDRRPVTLLEQRDENADELDGAEVVGLEDAPQGVRVGVHEVTGRTDARVVHQHVGPAEAGRHCVGHCPVVVAASNVAGQDFELAALGDDFGGERVEVGLLAGDGEDAAPAIDRFLRNRPADALRRPRHEQSHARQIPHCHRRPRSLCRKLG